MSKISSKNNIYDFLVFTNGPEAYAPKRMMAEARKKGLKAKIVTYDTLSCEFSADSSKANLPETKSVFLRGMGEGVGFLPLKYFILSYYQDKAKIINLKSFSTWPSLDKITQYIEYQKAGIPIVKSIFFGSGEAALNWGAGAGFPVIAKFNAGSKGIGIDKINSFEDLGKIVEKGPDIRTMIFQEFLTAGEDLRVIYLGGKVLGAMKRIARKGKFLTNYSQGGSVVKYDIEKDPEATKLVHRVAKLFKLDYCGVDLMKDNKGNWVVIEVNRACQFKGFEQATGINVASKVAEYLVS